MQLKRSGPVVLFWFLCVVLIPGGFGSDAWAQPIDSTFDIAAMTVGFGGRYTSAAESGGDAEIVANLSWLRFDQKKYRAFAIEVDWAAGDYIDFLSVYPRVEFGLGGGVNYGTAHGENVKASTFYVAAMAGYGTGTLWANTYLPIYGSEEDVEISASGFPLYGSIGYRRIGLLSFTVELVAGTVLLTSTEAEESEAEEPGAISSIGVRVAVGYDTFQKVWRAATP
jgi:hypothetical protein